MIIEFFIAILIFQAPGDPIPTVGMYGFATHDECYSYINAIEQNVRADYPEGIEIRVSCVSSESIGQNSV